eukprot:gnl/MRDRNA2_/MRDRNA2_95714_c0_seq1.p1 gnl/MRDRNA2_/MRDRNA2_95714_c0~~gnl/MRDRNA2_/MRDRNA2_95714_c0_seq1.p1  ORF type:complete len:129 (+),score=39.39 gnl/MRDRNA2_/MRDRNA2_95714_c0_seq1:95-481(+)
MVQDESSAPPTSAILADSQKLRRENAMLQQEVEVAKKRIRQKVQQMYQENDVLKRDNIRMQMLLAEVKQIRDVHATQEKENSAFMDEDTAVPEENTSLCEPLACLERVEPGKVMSTPRVSQAITAGAR